MFRQNFPGTDNIYQEDFPKVVALKQFLFEVFMLSVRLSQRSCFKLLYERSSE